MTEYRWIEDEEWNKLVLQFKLQVGETLGAFDMYGMGDLIPGAIAEITELFIDRTQKARGRDKPYSKIKRIYRRER